MTVDQAQVWIDEIAAAPALLRTAVAGLNDSQLDTTYRPEGWTVRQVDHHLPDSHMNAYIRFRNAVTATDVLPVAQPTRKRFGRSSMRYMIVGCACCRVSTRWGLIGGCSTPRLAS